MTRRDDHAFYWLRAAEELRRGEQAADATAAAVHYELAYRYGLLAAQTGTERPELTLVASGSAQVAA